jgi:hypothetical protein
VLAWLQLPWQSLLTSSLFRYRVSGRPIFIRSSIYHSDLVYEGLSLRAWARSHPEPTIRPWSRNHKAAVACLGKVQALAAPGDPVLPVGAPDLSDACRLSGRLSGDDKLNEVNLRPKSIMAVSRRAAPDIPGGAAYPFVDIQLLSDLVANHAWGEPTGFGTVFAWEDENGQIIPDARIFEKNQCSEVVGQKAVLIMSVVSKRDGAKAVIAHIPAETVCRYNCNTPGFCSDYSDQKFHRSIRLDRLRIHADEQAGSDDFCGKSWDALPPGFAGSFHLTLREYEKNSEYSLWQGLRLVATPVAVAIDVVTWKVQLGAAVLGSFAAYWYVKLTWK